MTLVEHLVELRMRLFKAALALSAAFLGVVTVGYTYVFDIIKKPYCDLPFELRSTSLSDPDGCELVAFGVADPFLLRMRISLIVALVIAGPVVAYQLWAFITPGLHAKEKRWAAPFLLCSTVLFAAGAVFSYITLDRGLRFLLGFGDDTVTPLLEAGRYLNYVIFMLLAFAVSFQFPLVLVFLELVGVVDHVKLRRWRRGMIFGIAVFTAVITPSQDPFTFLAMAVPMVMFYELVIVYSRLRARARRRRGLVGESTDRWADDETSRIDA